MGKDLTLREQVRHQRERVAYAVEYSQGEYDVPMERAVLRSLRRLRGTDHWPP